ncbi:MAG: hypothetical protein ACWGNO_16100 [Desulfobacterales bacterium]
MKKILLAIEGVAPDSRTFNYAVALCKRMRAGLEILQILSPHTYRSYLKKIRQGARRAKSVFEDAMVAVTFAEAGQHDFVEQMRIQACDNLNRLIPEQERDSLEYNLTLKPGNPDDEIVRYVCDHRDVVLTIYDAAGVKDEPQGRPDKKRNKIPAIAQKLPTPLVLRRGGESTGLQP